MMDVLVVEDETKVRELLDTTLRRDGYRVHTANDVDELADFICVRTVAPRVVILDRMLRGRDGAAMIPRIRAAFPQTAILVLSAIGSPEEKASAIDLGADDYLSKPFSIVELGARIRGLSRRAGATSVERVRVSLRETEVDLVARAVHVSGRKLDLTNKEFQLLALFMKSPSRVYDRYQLLDLIWEASGSVGSNVVEVTIRNLRGKLAGAGSSARIESKRNVGYWVEN